MNSQFVARCAASAREFTRPANRTACRGARMTGAFLCSMILTAGTPGLSQTRSQTPGTVVDWGDEVTPYDAPGTRFTVIAAGGGHTLALRSDGTVVEWWGERPGDLLGPSAPRRGTQWDPWHEKCNLPRKDSARQLLAFVKE